MRAVITSTPKKLKAAAIQMAWRGLMERVETQVAMALGASVQPLTRMTPRVSRTVMSRGGLVTSCCKKAERETVIKRASFGGSSKSGFPFFGGKPAVEMAPSI